VTYLRQITLEELKRRNYAESTIRAYLRIVEHFSRHFRRRPDQPGPEHIRQYQAALFTRRKLCQPILPRRSLTLGILLETRTLRQPAHQANCRGSRLPIPSEPTPCHRP
jgi:integrase/recombinase XerD